MNHQIKLARHDARPDAFDLECGGTSVTLRHVYQDERRVILKNDMAGTFFEVNARGIFSITAAWAQEIMRT